MCIAINGVVFGCPRVVPPNDIPRMLNAYLQLGDMENQVLALENAAAAIRAGNYDGLGGFVAGLYQWGQGQCWQEHLERVQNNRPQLQAVLGAVVEAVQNGENDQAVFKMIARKVPGVGPTYATKFLRFLWPQRFPALDSTLSHFFGYRQTPAGYACFAERCREAAATLTGHVQNPIGGRELNWFAADVEMAVFALVNGWA